MSVNNIFGNVTSRNTYHWTQADNQTNAWTNNKENSWTYDADGRLKNTPENKYYYDARGATVMVTLNNNRRTIQHLDGEGRAVRQDRYTYYNYQYNLLESAYFIYSSVLGKLLTEIGSDGAKKRTFVYGTGGVVALQHNGGENQEVRWEHTDPSNASYVQTGYDGLMYYLDSPAELDPLGSNVGLSNPYNNQTNSPQNLGAGGWGYGSWGDPFGGYSCMVDWISQPCSVAAGILSAGAGVIYDGPQFTQVRYNGQTVWAVFQYFNDGYGGYVPSNARYIGNGYVRPIGSGGPPQLTTYVRGTPRDTNLSLINGVRGTSETDLKRMERSIVMPWNLPNRRLNDREVSDLQANVETLLNSGDCKDFIKDLILIAGLINTPSPAPGTIPNRIVSTNISNVFDSVSREGGFHSTPTGSISSLRGILGRGDARVYLAGLELDKIPDVARFLDDPSERDKAIRQYQAGLPGQRALTAIHELIHFNFGDEQLARAVAIMNGTTAPSDLVGASNFWSEELRKHCDPRILLK